MSVFFSFRFFPSFSCDCLATGFIRPCTVLIQKLLNNFFILLDAMRNYEYKLSFSLISLFRFTIPLPSEWLNILAPIVPSVIYRWSLIKAKDNDNYLNKWDRHMYK